MKAIRINKFGGTDNLKISTLPIPSIKDDEVLIHVRAAGINPIDTHIREGTFPSLPSLPAILGKEVAGVVEEVGHCVENIKDGDRVFGCLIDGGYAEYVACKGKCVFPLSENLSFSEGASIYVPYFTAYRALVTKCRVKPGEILLVHGASGPVGIAAVQIAKAKGLTVVGTAGSEEEMEMVKEVGADYVFNHKVKGYLNNAVAAIGGQGFNVVFENLANVNLGADLTVLNQKAKVAVVGCEGPVELNPRSLILTESTIIGVALLNITEEEYQETAKAVLRGIEDGWLRPVVGKEYSLENAAQAHEDIVYKEGTHGKLVFKL